MTLSASPPSLAQVLAGLTREGELYDRLPDKAVRCFACGHCCTIPVGRPGVCKVRFNAGGVLKVPWGYVGALQCDPIEKKPFFHALPGSRALSFGMLGCDYHCAYCQNWITSQTLRDPEAQAEPRLLSPEDLVGLALEQRAPVVASTYNEPLITSEWGVAVFREARRARLLTAYISNGNGTERVLDYIQPHINLYKIDLKSFSDRRYRSLGGTLAAVLRTLESVWRRGIWLEIVTLLIPGFNDSPEEVRDMAHFIGGLSRDIPWHLTGFHTDYRMTDRADTDSATLRRCAEIARGEGLRFVYAGNLPGRVGDLEDTRCPGCQAVLIARRGFHILSNRMNPAGTCPDCGAAVPGVWSGGVRHPARPMPILGHAPRGPEAGILHSRNRAPRCDARARRRRARD